MDLLLNIDLKKFPKQISYRDKILLVGSCFTEHIGGALEDLKFPVLQNPHGILFDPVSVCNSLISYIEPRQYTKADLFELNEVWHSWGHHSRFSNTDPDEAIRIINASQQKAHAFLKETNWVIITLGSAFTYRLNDLTSVANCHRAPAQWFNKHLVDITEIIKGLEECLKKLTAFNPGLNFIFTVSPVRHIRDGVVENNLSKARLIESVHHIVNKLENAYYFPAYELVIDVLRDYRFYDIDLVHPNYPATEFVLEKFADCCIDPGALPLMEEIRKIVIARKHKAFQPNTQAHRHFLENHFVKAKDLQKKYPFLDLNEELDYFSQTSAMKDI